MTHYIEQKLNEIFVKGYNLDSAIDNSDLISEFSMNTTDSLIKQLGIKRSKDHVKPFRLSMSNVGKDLRQLSLEKLYGVPDEEEVDPSFRVRMLTGDMLEAVFVTAMRLAGINIKEEQRQVNLKLDNGNITGTLDVVVANPIRQVDEVWDIKTASDYAFKNKFKDFETLKKNDPFGYITQLYGYTAALWDEGLEVAPGGWIVINKNNGNYKVITVPEKYDEDADEAVDYINYVHRFLNDPNFSADSIPPCSGAVDEMWRGKKTGEKILSGSCVWCPYKNNCHPEGVEYRVCDHSKAKEPKYKWYVK